MSTLQEQVDAIKPGDEVTARFTSGGDEYVISGRVQDKNGWLALGFTCLRRGSVPPEYLVAIESHEPAQPPVPPEPTGDCIIVDSRGCWMSREPNDGLWYALDGDTSDWETIARHFNPVRVYRPVEEIR